MDVVAMVTQVARSIAAYFGYAQQRDGERNAPDVKAAAIQTQEQKDIDRIRNNVAQGNLNEIRKDDAE